MRAVNEAGIINWAEFAEEWLAGCDYSGKVVFTADAICRFVSAHSAAHSDSCVALSRMHWNSQGTARTIVAENGCTGQTWYDSSPWRRLRHRCGTAFARKSSWFSREP
jgi:hypothetical protein